MAQAQELLRKTPRSANALALAVDAAIVLHGSTAGLDQYERWLGSRTLEEPGILRRISSAALHEAARNPATRLLALRGLAGAGDESAFSNMVSYTVPGGSSASTGGSTSGGGGGCFIATAAYGSRLAPEVAMLREFRDRYLLANAPGQAFVEWYYRVSPPAAAFIAKHESLKTAVRWGLAPIVCSIKYPLLLPVALGIVGLILVGRRSRR